MANYHGDIALGQTIDIAFTTTSASTGAPTQLAGSPVISAYIGNSTTQLTAGITLTVDFDGVTGHNNVRVVASGGNGYAAATDVSLVITTGTVGGTSAVGYCIGAFSIENRVANVTKWNGTAVATPATAGIPDVNAKNINNVATTSVTTIAANVGTTQPLNFTGSAGAATVKSDVTNVGAAALSTSAAQIGVNVVNFGGSAGTFSGGRPEVNTTHLRGTLGVGVAGYVGIDWSAINAPTTTVNLSGTTISTAQAIASVSGAVGSVTGAVGSVAGAVGSVTARVTANTDQLAGQTVTAAAGVTFPSSVASPTNITAGTITTVTNLTNAPTAGDFTAAMKTSLNAATPVVTISGVTIAGGVLPVDVKKINAVTVNGTGVLGNEWGP